MIPSAYIQEWSAATPWPDPRQVAFRGGTAINKLLFRRPLRYSEDIDFVQVRPEAIGPTVDAIRRALTWLGRCRRRAARRLIARLSGAAWHRSERVIEELRATSIRSLFRNAGV